ncbi:MAG: prepilin peptidase [Sphingomonas sp.]|jgi:prepilin peptidase CpaA
MTELSLYAAIAVLIMAGVQDVWRLRITNFFPIAIVALYPAWVAAVGFDWSIWQNCAVFAVTLMIGILAFSRGLLGGGDVKLLAAIALWFDIQGSAALFAYVSIGGLLLSLALIIGRRLVPSTLLDRSGALALRPKGPIPYGVAIAGGAILALAAANMNPNPAQQAHKRLQELIILSKDGPHRH